MDKQEKIWAYIDGQMSDGDSRSFQVLLESDANLSREFEKYKTLNDFLAKDMQWSAPKDIDIKILKNLESQAKVKPEIDFSPIKYLWAATAACLAIMVFCIAFSNDGTSSSILKDWVRLPMFELQQDYSTLLESCKTYIYLSLFCAAVFTLAMSLDQLNWRLLSTRNYKL